MKSKLSRRLTIEPEETKELNLLIQQIKSKLVTLEKCHRVIELGSVPRGTYLKTSKIDIDFFIYYKEFDYEFFLRKVEQLFPKYTLIQKNRGFPYCTLISFRGIKKIFIDLVPCVVENQGQKDNTQLHHEYMCKNLTDDLKRQVIYSKYLLKKVGLYEADSKVKGFSGFCVENLIINYGALGLVPDDLTHLPDPVNPLRNLLASVSIENMQRFHLLKRSKFRNPIGPNLVKQVYVIDKAPLSAHYVFKKDPNVVNAVYMSQNLLFELRDVYTTPHKMLSYESSFWTQKKNQIIYKTVAGGMKKLCKERIFERYPYKFRLLGDSRSDRNLKKTYQYFK